jgi:AraC family transcriptional regulator of adaptative response/methylated-DNA-[protein]-cysteine methyltransferase
LVASTAKSICHLAFADDEKKALDILRQKFPNAQIVAATDRIPQEASHIFQNVWFPIRKVKLHLPGTPFQIKVWEVLLKIPWGLTTYG